ncbi:MAG: hypothetical protein HRT63_12450 [Erythrobacter sp.]|nr:hypothetical protein [Erythrobacter sp.]
MSDHNKLNAGDAKSQDEAIAKRRYLIMGFARIAGLAAVLLGIAIARSVVEAPYIAGVALAIGGMLGFFFGPALLAKHWKAGDRGAK